MDVGRVQGAGPCGPGDSPAAPSARTPPVTALCCLLMVCFCQSFEASQIATFVISQEIM